MKGKKKKEKCEKGDHERKLERCIPVPRPPPIPSPPFCLFVLFFFFFLSWVSFKSTALYFLFVFLFVLFYFVFRCFSFFFSSFFFCFFLLRILLHVYVFWIIQMSFVLFFFFFLKRFLNRLCTSTNCCQSYLGGISLFFLFFLFFWVILFRHLSSYSLLHSASASFLAYVSSWITLVNLIEGFSHTSFSFSKKKRQNVQATTTVS